MLKTVLSRDFRNTSVDEITQKINGSGKYRFFSRINNILVPFPENGIKTYHPDVKLENGERSGVRDRMIDCIRFNFDGESDIFERDLVVGELKCLFGFDPSLRSRNMKKEDDIPFVAVSYYVLNGDKGWYRIDKIGLRIFSSTALQFSSSMLEEYAFGAR